MNEYDNFGRPFVNVPQQQVPQPTTPTPTPAPAQAPAKAAPKQYLSPFDNAGPQKPQTAAQKAHDTDGFSMAEVLGVLGKASQDAMRTASMMQVAANKGEINAKQSGADAMKRQVHGEQVSEATKLAGAFGNAGLTAGMAYKGADMTLNGPKRKPGMSAEDASKAYARHMTTGTMLDSTSKAIGAPITEGVNTADKLAGGAHEADQAKVAAKIDEVNETIAKTQVEATKQSVQQAQEAFKNVSSVSLAHLQRWEGVYNRI